MESLLRSIVLYCCFIGTCISLRICPSIDEYPKLETSSEIAMRLTTARIVTSPLLGSMSFLDSISTTADDVISARAFVYSSTTAPTISMAYFDSINKFIPKAINRELQFNANNGEYSIVVSFVIDSIIEYNDQNENGVFDDGVDEIIQTSKLSEELWDNMCYNSLETKQPLKIFNVVNVPNHLSFSFQCYISSVEGKDESGNSLTPNSINFDVNLTDYTYKRDDSKLAFGILLASSSSPSSSSLPPPSFHHADGTAHIGVTANNYAIYYEWGTRAKCNNENCNIVLSSILQSKMSELEGLSRRIYLNEEGGDEGTKVIRTYFSVAASHPSAVSWAGRIGTGNPPLHSTPLTPLAPLSSHSSHTSALSTNYVLIFLFIGLMITIAAMMLSYRFYRNRKDHVQYEQIPNSGSLDTENM